MADTAFQTQYRQEFIAGFEDGQSVLRSTTTTEAVIKGNQRCVPEVVEFRLARPQPRAAPTASSRPVPTATPSYTATLAEWHDLVRKTNFNIFASPRATSARSCSSPP
jgi:hypothetical protein